VPYLKFNDLNNIFPNLGKLKDEIIRVIGYKARDFLLFVAVVGGLI
jgi:hypothetical protein